MDYIILSDEHPVDLSKKVREFISNGWIPQGGIAVIHNNNSMYTNKTFYQAMVKTK